MPIERRRGTAIKDHASADAVLPRPPATRRDPGSLPAQPGRFSPLTAPQRALVDAFLAEARPWALRQARRSYGHLPAELHDQAVDQAMLALRTGAPRALDRRTLYGLLADELTQALRRAHVGWCLNRVPGGADQAVHGAHPLASFVEEGLGGLERAVLQMEIGAGRDTASSRAALRLGPRNYQRHRDEGLTKLRAAIAGLVQGRVCDDHADAVTLAATGDRDASARLSAGPSRCRACAREAGALQRVLHERLALAPWPLAIKPAGMVAAKLGALGAVAGGKSAGGGAGLTLSGGALAGGKSVAAVLAAAVVATGGAAVVGDGSERTSPAAVATTPAETREAASAATTAVAPAGAERRERASEPRTTVRKRRAERRRSTERTTAAAPAATAAPQDQPQQTAETTQPTAPAKDPVRDTVDKTVDTVGKTVDGVKKTVDQVKSRLPVKTDPQTSLPDVKGTVDEVTGTVEGLLKP